MYTAAKELESEEDETLASNAAGFHELGEMLIMGALATIASTGRGEEECLRVVQQVMIETTRESQKKATPRAKIGFTVH